jgi:hypothetical protein
MSAAPGIRPRGFTAWWVGYAGIACLVGALLHVAIAIGGPDWYAFFGAPRGLVAMARAGNLRAPLSCIAIAAILGVFAAYAFSAIGVIRRLPLLHAGLALIGAILILRGLLFVPILLWRPYLLAGICDCRVIDAFIVVSSLACLAVGAGFAVGVRELTR